MTTDTREHRGSTTGFVLVYLLFVLAIGLPPLLAGLAIGGSARREPASAFAALGGPPRWRADSGLAQPLDRWWHTSARHAAPLPIAVVPMQSPGPIPLA